jgi:hypothetical protein
MVLVIGAQLSLHGGKGFRGMQFFQAPGALPRRLDLREAGIKHSRTL